MSHSDVTNHIQENSHVNASEPSSAFPRVLIVAEHASARFGGEAILPLHYFRMLHRRGVNVWLVVHARTRNELAEILTEEEFQRITFLPDLWLHKRLNQFGRFLPNRLSYNTLGLLGRLSTQSMAREVARKLIREQGIGVVHQPMPVSPKELSLMYGLETPVVIGPMNGGMNYPPAFRDQFESRWTSSLIRLGRLSSHLMNHLIPGKIRASILLVANDRTRRALPAGVRGTVVELVENGVEFGITCDNTPIRLRQDQDPVRFVFIGRLVDWKGVNLLLDAFQAVRTRLPAELEIVGDGPLRGQLQEQAQSSGLGDAVHFTGWVAHAKVAQHLQEADVLVLPSLYECGGAVVLEAMAAGLPVIATNWGGPADYLDETCGILVDPSSPTEFVSGLTEAMTQLAADSELRAEMGRAGRDRIALLFDWEKKIDRILEIYEQALLPISTTNRVKS